MNCPKCSAPIREGVKFCSKCGSPLYSTPVLPTTADANKAVCAKCGTQLNPGSKLCASCGFEMYSASVHDESDTLLAAAEILLTPESPKTDRPDDTPSRSSKPEDVPPPKMPSRQKTKLWMPICAALVFVLGVGGLIILQYRNNIRDVPTNALQSDASS